jgi:hypothetical protein
MFRYDIQYFSILTLTIVVIPGLCNKWANESTKYNNQEHKVIQNLPEVKIQYYCFKSSIWKCRSNGHIFIVAKDHSSRGKALPEGIPSLR